jgi:hypothetical protein
MKKNPFVIMSCILAIGLMSGCGKTWNKTYDVGGGALSVQQTSDGGYILAGYSGSNGADNDALLIKTDEDGNEQWNKTFGGLGDDYAYSVQQTKDGGYILAGTFNSFWSIFQPNYAWLIKTDANGKLQWNKTFGLDYLFYSVQQTKDGEYMAGLTDSYGAGGLDTWLITTGANEIEQWNKTFIEYLPDSWAYSVQQTIDGGYILAVDTDYKPWLIKTDAFGNAPRKPTP